LPSGSNSGIIDSTKQTKDSKMRSMIEEMVDELLDQEGDIQVAGSTFARSAILRELDPVAYREMCVDMADSLISDLNDELERLDPEVDAEEMEDIAERIFMLEHI
jgi:prephenate dehydrogenase